MSNIVQAWESLDHDEREQAIDALESVPGPGSDPQRVAMCRCGSHRTPGLPPFRIRSLYQAGWRWMRSIYVPLDFNGSAGAAWLCPTCAGEEEIRESESA